MRTIDLILDTCYHVTIRGKEIGPIGYVVRLDDVVWC